MTPGEAEHLSAETEKWGSLIMLVALLELSAAVGVACAVAVALLFGAWSWVPFLVAALLAGLGIVTFGVGVALQSLSDLLRP